MPRRKTSLKSQRQDKKRHQRNVILKRNIKKTLKTFQTYLSQKNITEAKKFLSTVFSKLDKAVNKGILKKNSASRKKSRLNRLLLKVTKS